MKGKSGYLKWGLTIFLTVCAILVFYDTFYMSGALQRLLSKLASILSPVLVGLVMAYLLAPIPAFGLPAIWWAIPIGWGLADLTGFLWYRFVVLRRGI